MVEWPPYKLTTITKVSFKIVSYVCPWGTFNGSSFDAKKNCDRSKRIDCWSFGELLYVADQIFFTVSGTSWMVRKFLSVFQWLFYSPANLEMQTFTLKLSWAFFAHYSHCIEPFFSEAIFCTWKHPENFWVYILRVIWWSGLHTWICKRKIDFWKIGATLSRAMFLS